MGKPALAEERCCRFVLNHGTTQRLFFLGCYFGGFRPPCLEPLLLIRRNGDFGFHVRRDRLFRVPDPPVLFHRVLVHGDAGLSWTPRANHWHVGAWRAFSAAQCWFV